MLSIIKKFESGQINKKNYWLSMQPYHVNLLDYHCLLSKDSIVKSIEITANSLLVTLINGLKFVWDSKDLRSPVSVAVNNGIYENEELEFLESIVNKLKVLFDVGANIGWFSLHLSKFVLKNDSEIYAFEPVKNSFNQLEKNINLNQVKNIKIYNTAFGEKDGKVTFFVPAVTGSVAASMTNILDEDCLKEECSIKRLDDFVLSNKISQIDFLKCDVEGAEILVLKGGLESIKSFKPILFVEMLRKWASKFNYHPNDTISLLAQIGYSCYYLENKKLVLIDNVDETTTATNFLFLDQVKHKNLISKYS